MFKHICIATLIATFATPSYAFWGNGPKKRNCRSFLDGQLSTKHMVDTYNLRMPPHFQNGRSLSTAEVETYCLRTLGILRDF